MNQPRHTLFLLAVGLATWSTAGVADAQEPPVVFDYVFEFNGSNEGWASPACAGYSYTVQPGYLSARETTGSYTCDPAASGKMELGWFRDFPNPGGSIRVRAWMRSKSAFSGSSQVTNQSIKVLDASMLSTLAERYRYWPYTNDTGWIYVDYDPGNVPFWVPTVRMVVGMYDQWLTAWSQEFQVDYIRVTGYAPTYVCGDGVCNVEQGEWCGCEDCQLDPRCL